MASKDKHLLEVSYLGECPLPTQVGGRDYLFKAIEITLGSDSFRFYADACEPLNSHYEFPPQLNSCLRFIGGYANSSFFNRKVIDSLSLNDKGLLLLELRKATDAFIERKR